MIEATSYRIDFIVVVRDLLQGNINESSQIGKMYNLQSETISPKKSTRDLFLEFESGFNALLRLQEFEGLDCPGRCGMVGYPTEVDTGALGAMGALIMVEHHSAQLKSKALR